MVVTPFGAPFTFTRASVLFTKARLLACCGARLPAPFGMEKSAVTGRDLCGQIQLILPPGRSPLSFGLAKNRANQISGYRVVVQ